MQVAPLGVAQQTEVIAEVRRYQDKLASEFSIEVPSIDVHFDLIGGTVGMYCRKRNQRSFRFNSYLFSKYWYENIENTVPHEVAHYACDLLFDYRRIRPHGREWQAIMQFFGVEPTRTCQFDLEGIPKRSMRRFNYYCRCDTHQLSAIRHNRVERGQQRYVCRHCRSELIALSS
jgi:SprT protein